MNRLLKPAAAPMRLRLHAGAGLCPPMPHSSYVPGSTPIPAGLEFVDEPGAADEPEMDEAPAPSCRAIVTAFPPDDGTRRPSWFYRCASDLGKAAGELTPGSYGFVLCGWRTLTAIVDAIHVAGFEYRGMIAWGASHGRQARFVVVGRKAGHVPEIALPGFILADSESAVVAELVRRLPPTPELIDPFGTVIR
jgi:hypothetical protein